MNQDEAYPPAAENNEQILSIHVDDEMNQQEAYLHGAENNEDDSKEQNPDARISSKKKTSSIKNKQLVPTWSATHSLLADKDRCKDFNNCAVVAPLFRQSPTDYIWVLCALSSNFYKESALTFLAMIGKP